MKPRQSSLVYSLIGALGASALVLAACGGSSPSSPSDRGVVLQGTVLSATGDAGFSAQSGAASAKGKMVVTVQQAPSITATVAANGTFELSGLPAGTITLVFTIDGVVVGSITIDGVSAGAEVTIVVQITPDGVVLIEIRIEGQDDDDDPGTPPGTGTACLISGGTVGSSIELEGKVASGNASLFELDVQGNRARGLVDVNASGASYRCIGQSGPNCKADLKAGNQVHVRGLLTTCTTTDALVTATEVKVQKP